MTDTSLLEGDVFFREPRKASSSTNTFLEERLHASITSFGQVRHLLTEFVSEGMVEVVSIIEHNGDAYGKSSVQPDRTVFTDTTGGQSFPDRNTTFLSCSDMRDPKAEQRVTDILLASGLANDSLRIIYKTTNTPTETATFAFVFGDCDRCADSTWKQDASGIFQVSDLASCFIYVCLQYCLSPRQSETFLGLANDLLKRAACQLLVQNVAKGATDQSNDSIYSLCCDIAESQYEGRAGSGSFIFCRRDQDEAVATIKFQSPVHATHFVGVRKLIEMASDNFALLFDGNYFWGFTSLSHLNLLPHIAFKGRGVWSIHSGDDLICLVSYGAPISNKRVLTEKEFKQHLREVFPTITRKGLDNIWQIATIAAEQPVGTNILFTPEARNEARRLSSQCIPITPVELSQDITMQLTAIDGTVITDIDGNVHALGAIMDGASTKNGTWQRGGRYNSAANYVEATDFPSLIFIVSQDGYVDIVPPIRQVGQKWKQRRYLKLSSTAI